jgi:ABC-type Mn2+/Zn2+ transport system permease subunit
LPIGIARAEIQFRPFALYAAIGIVHFIFRKKFLAISFDPRAPRRKGFPFENGIFYFTRCSAWW